MLLLAAYGMDWIILAVVALAGTRCMEGVCPRGHEGINHSAQHGLCPRKRDVDTVNILTTVYRLQVPVTLLVNGEVHDFIMATREMK